jgi:hypothetical protein
VECVRATARPGSSAPRKMLNLLHCLLLAAPAASAILPRAGSSQEASSHFSKRGLFGAIDTSAPDNVAGGRVTCAAPPVNSFFAGLKPPVPFIPRFRNPREAYTEFYIVPNQHMVGLLCCHSRNRGRCWPVSIRIISRRHGRSVRY